MKLLNEELNCASIFQFGEGFGFFAEHIIPLKRETENVFPGVLREEFALFPLRDLAFFLCN